ncbi:30S ribosomal protein S6 [bacterium]|nr:MAG: 30S ribosomal protein S6 [bacterium]
MEYELLFFTYASSESKVPGIKKDLEEILTSHGGKLSGDFTDIGKRKFAYPIKRETHGYYSFVRFTLEDKEKLPEINKRIGLMSIVTRHLIVKAAEVGKPVSAIEMPAREIMAEEKKIEEIPREKAIESKPKASMADLDEKLNELLDETPS